MNCWATVDAEVEVDETKYRDITGTTWKGYDMWQPPNRYGKLETMKEQVFVSILDPYSGITYGISLEVIWGFPSILGGFFRDAA